LRTSTSAEPLDPAAVLFGSTRRRVLELFEEAKNRDTPIIVERVVNDIDEIVRVVRFDGWQSTHAGEREVKLRASASRIR
jgi:hypothetical protein